MIEEYSQYHQAHTSLYLTYLAPFGGYSDMLLEDRKFHPKLNLVPLLRKTRSNFDKIFVSEN